MALAVMVGAFFLLRPCNDDVTMRDQVPDTWVASGETATRAVGIRSLEMTILDTLPVDRELN